MNKHQGPDDNEQENQAAQSPPAQNPEQLPEKQETDDVYAREGYNADRPNETEPAPDYSADERPDVEVNVAPIPDNERPDAAGDADETPLPSRPV